MGDDSGSKKRFCARSALLTYKTHLDKQAYIDWFTNGMSERKVKPLVIKLAHETGDDDPENPYDHTHVVFQLDKILETTNMRFFDYGEIHCHIKVLKNTRAVNDAIAYISKQDPDNAATKREASVIDGIWKCSSIQEALKTYCKKPNDAMGVVTVFNNKAINLKITEDDTPKHQWQLDLIEDTKRSPTPNDRRRIRWFYDPCGATGKTQLARYLLMTQPNEWFVSKDMGTSKDAATIIENALKNGWSSHGIIIDLPRQAQNHDRMYTYLEEIKDGMVTTQKYSGGTSIFNVPHMIVFANWLPKFDAMSHDRLRYSTYQLTRERKTGVITCERYVPSRDDFICKFSDEVIDGYDDFDNEGNPLDDEGAVIIKKKTPKMIRRFHQSQSNS